MRGAGVLAVQRGEVRPVSILAVGLAQLVPTMPLLLVSRQVLECGLAGPTHPLLGCDAMLGARARVLTTPEVLVVLLLTAADPGALVPALLGVLETPILVPVGRLTVPGRTVLADRHRLPSTTRDEGR